MRIWRIFLQFLCVSPCLSLNILGLFPHPGRSHFDVFESLLKELVTRGHNLTVIGHFPLKHPIPGYTDISLKEYTDKSLGFIGNDSFPAGKLKFYRTPIILSRLAEASCKGLRTKSMQNFKKNEQIFDLIIMEIFNSDCFLGFAHKYKIPFIGLSSCTIMPWSNRRFGNPVNPSHIPNHFAPFSDRMSFLERVENTIYYLYTEIIFQYFIEPSDYVEAKNYFGNDLPPLHEIAKNTSLMLVNTHFSLNLPRPLVPNVIEIGGMFLRKPRKLPQNLETFINESSDGVIYFSMGSMIKEHTFPEEKRQAFLSAFSKLKQRVLWKWGNDIMSDKPKNVLIQQWMPQYDILCHPNVVAFISHGGLLGTEEAVQCGVPMIVLPQFGDQFVNAEAIKAVGFGIVLDFAEITEESLSKALDTVLQPSFKRQAEMVSAKFRDRPMSPMDTAVYWVEYVARHGGAHHMRSAAVDLPFYQEMLLDVIAFLILVLFVFIGVVYYIIRTLIIFLICRGESKQKMQ